MESEWKLSRIHLNLIDLISNLTHRNKELFRMCQH